MFTTTADELPRIMACEGSRLMPASFPVEAGDTSARDEGTAAHYLAQAVFNNEFTFDELTDRKAPNGVYISTEMADHVAQYLSALDCGETEIDTSYGTDAWRINSRADHIAFNHTVDTLIVDDLKYGWRLVSPVNHWSLVWHAIGYCIARQLRPAHVELRIHQPRPWHPDGPCRTWRITGDELWALYAIINAKLSALSDALTTGPQCNGCHAMATCPAYRAANMNALDATDHAIPDDMPNDALSYELDVLTAAQSVIENRLDALRDLASHRLSLGQLIENYSRQATYANTRWRAGLDGATLSLMAGKDLTKPAALVTPTEAKRRGMSEAVIKSLTERPMTGQKLVRSTATERANRLLGNKG